MHSSAGAKPLVAEPAGVSPGAEPASSAVVLGTEPPITEKNWMAHPRIRECRATFQEVQDLESRGLLTTLERSGDESCENYNGDMQRTIRRDASGKARKLTLEAGSEDSAVTVDAYYDTQAKLRFIFVKASAVNDTVYEYRIYFDAEGTKLWENEKLVRGAGYTFPSPWPEEFIPRDPEARFASSPACN